VNRRHERSGKRHVHEADNGATIARVGSRAIMFALGFALVGACSTDEPQTLGDREFLSESVEGRTLVAGTSIHMNFFGDGLGASLGCNSMNTEQYALVDGHVECDWFSITELGCEAPRHEQDEWFLAFLQGSPAYSLVEPRLTLSDDDVTVVLIDREVADPDRPLEGRNWEVTGLIENGFVFVAEFSPAQLSFSDSGSFSIVTPCSPGIGSFDVVGSTLVLSGVQLTPNECPDQEFAMRAHEHMSLVLADGEVEHHIDADSLTIERGDIGLYLSTE
jgi:heat shock protein HslJ